MPMQNFKQFLIEKFKKAKRRKTKEALEKEAMRQAARRTSKQVDREAENADRKANPTGDPQEDELIKISDEETLLNNNIFDLIDIAGERNVNTPYNQITKRQALAMSDVEDAAERASKKAYASKWADIIMSRQPIIANKALQDAARRYEIETKTEKKIPLFGGAHKKFIYKHG